MGTATYTEATTTGSLIGAIRVDTAFTSLADTTNEIAPLQMNSTGFLRTVGSPIIEVAVLQMIDGSAEGDVTKNEYLASDAISITGSGRLVKICSISSETIIAESSEILFFDSDPAITAETTDLTFEEAQLVVATIKLAAADYYIEADSAINCQDLNTAYHAITHVVIKHTGETTLANTDVAIHV